jgi:PIN domain nuclease of toxin-antitoxin system
VKVVADSHALVWFAQSSPQLSAPEAEALREAEGSDGITVSVATLIDLWYITQTTEAVNVRQLSELRADNGITRGRAALHPVDLAVTDAYTAIDRELLKDPWDRFIIATAQTLQVPLVTRDRAIQRSGLIETIW